MRHVVVGPNDRLGTKVSRSSTGVEHKPDRVTFDQHFGGYIRIDAAPVGQQGYLFFFGPGFPFVFAKPESKGFRYIDLTVPTSNHESISPQVHGGCAVARNAPWLTPRHALVFGKENHVSALVLVDIGPGIVAGRTDLYFS